MAPFNPDLYTTLRTALLLPSPLARYALPPPRRGEFGDLLLLAGTDYQYALALGPVPPEEVFARAATFFGGPTAFTIELAVEVATALERELSARRWQCEEEEPALILPAIPVLPPPPRDLSIQRVADERSLAACHAISPASARRVPTLAAATDPAVGLYLGYVGDQAVATARLTCLGQVAEITSVNTVERFRRRGYATAMTWAAIAGGAEYGCTSALLTASAMGHPVYLRMGFQPVCTFRTYGQLAPLW